MSRVVSALSPLVVPVINASKGVIPLFRLPLIYIIAVKLHEKLIFLVVINLLVFISNVVMVFWSLKFAALLFGHLL